jgi:crotonobetainyl-CoA:carnitine CoA-transferase CaiB-like acyl-CoA transferase
VSGAYAGLRVLDFTHVIAGPFCTRLMADLGADVVKVESPTGDLMRKLPIAYEPGMSTAFAQYNCGKRSIGLNLRIPEGLAIAKKLVGWADVVAENFSPGTMDRLGLGWDVVHGLNPRAVLLSVSLFGREGPHSGLSGFGTTAEAYSGLMSLAGPEGGPPVQFGTPLADMSAGVHALAAVGAALYERERSGEGRLVDISSFDCLYSMIDQAVGQLTFTKGQRHFGHFGGRSPQTVPSGVFATRGGEFIALGAPGDEAWKKLAAAMQRPDLADDPRFAGVEARIAHKDELYPLIDAWAGSFPDAESLVAHLAEHGVHGARIRSIEETIDDPQLTFRGTLQPVDFGRAGTHLVQSAPYWISGCDVGPTAGPPRAGEHTDTVLHGILELSDEEVNALHAQRAVF